MKLFQDLFFKIYLLLIHLSVLVLSQDDEDYEHYENDFNFCTITCNGKEHTMCKYPEPDGPYKCAALTHGMLENMKRNVIEVHNNYRQQVAMGKGDAGEPPAANMVELKWSDEAAMIAQRWADQCTEKGPDECRSLSNMTPGGQNVADTNKNEEYDVYKFLQLNVIHWFKVGNVFNKDSLHSYKYDPKTTSYSQIIWALTDIIGCGYVHGDMNGTGIFRLVCNYYPAGNIEGKSVYVQGRPCSKCPNAKCSVKYPALCAAPSEQVYNRGEETDSGAPGGPSGSYYTVSIVSVFLVLCRG